MQIQTSDVAHAALALTVQVSLQPSKADTVYLLGTKVVVLYFHVAASS